MRHLSGRIRTRRCTREVMHQSIRKHPSLSVSVLLAASLHDCLRIDQPSSNFLRNSFTQLQGEVTKEAGMSVLAFRTPPGGVKIPAGHSVELGTVDVSKYSKIRVVADERIGSGSGVTLRLTMTEGN